MTGVPKQLSAIETQKVVSVVVVCYAASFCALTCYVNVLAVRVCVILFCNSSVHDMQLHILHIRVGLKKMTTRHKTIYFMNYGFLLIYRDQEYSSF